MIILKSVLACVAIVAVGGVGTAWAGRSAGPASTTAKVEATSNGKAVVLQRPEQIALMFMAAISSLESDCVRHADHTCSMDELMSGLKTKDGWGVGHLKFDPRTTDPNYTYTVSGGAKAWEAKAIPRKPGLGGFYFVGADSDFPKKFYNPKGAATVSSTELDGYSIDGDIFTKN